MIDSLLLFITAHTVVLFCRHLPYNATPAYLKAKTDAAFKLFDEINSTVLNENAMTPREVKALEQVIASNWNVIRVVYAKVVMGGGGTQFLSFHWSSTISYYSSTY